MIWSTLIYRNTFFEWSDILPTSHCSCAWVIWYLISNLSLTPPRLQGSSSPAQPHDLIYVDWQECIVQMLRHLSKSSFDRSGAWVIWYLIYNLLLTPPRLEGSFCPAQPHDPTYTDLQEYIVQVFRHHYLVLIWLLVRSGNPISGI